MAAGESGRRYFSATEPATRPRAGYAESSADSRAHGNIIPTRRRICRSNCSAARSTLRDTRPGRANQTKTTRSDRGCCQRQSPGDATRELQRGRDVGMRRFKGSILAGF